MAQNINQGLGQSNAVPSGISKHVYSTHPDRVVDENIYTEDTSSKNRDQTYQTLQNRTVPTGTSEKINPFNVKGVPGCRSCGGSGWKDEAKHPHPCNECAKKTVPIIDTFLTKIGQTATPVADTVTVPRTVQVTDYEERVVNVPVTKEVEVTRTVPVTREVPVTEQVQKTVTVPVTRMEERVREVPVKREVPYTETVQVTEKIPRIEYQEITKEVPITKEKEIREEIPVKRSVLEKIEVLPEVYRGEVIRETGIQYGGEFIESPQQFVGISGCSRCKGEGFVKGKKGLRMKACDECVKMTGFCPDCSNTGIRLDKNKKCHCIFAKSQ